jgi:hypothetical protein
VGGVRRDDVFLNELKHLLSVNDSKVKHAGRKLRFLLLVAGDPVLHRGGDEMHDFWCLNENSEEKFFKFVKKITKLLESGNKKEVLERKAYLVECRNMSSSHFLTIPKFFGMNVFGDFGSVTLPNSSIISASTENRLTFRRFTMNLLKITVLFSSVAACTPFVSMALNPERLGK